MQHLGLVANTVSFVGVLYILYRWGLRHKLTFSDHVSSGAPRRMYLSVSLLAIVAFTVFFFAWLTPNTDYTAAFYWFVGAAYVLEAVTTAVPRRGRLVYTHDVLAVAAGTAMGFSLAAVLIAGDTSDDTRALLLVTSLVMTPLGISLLYRNRPNYLVNQLLYHMLFLVWLTFFTYSGS